MVHLPRRHSICRGMGGGARGRVCGLTCPTVVLETGFPALSPCDISDGGNLPHGRFEQAAVLNRYMHGVLYVYDARSVYPDRDELRDLCEEVVVAERNVTEDSAAALLDQEFDFPSQRGSGRRSRVALIKKLRGAVHKLLDKVTSVACDAFLQEYHDLTGSGTMKFDMNDKEVLVFAENDALKCVWEDSFIRTAKGRRAMLAAVLAICDKLGCITDFFIPASATNPEEYYEETIRFYALVVLKVCVHLTAWWRMQRGASVAGRTFKPCRPDMCSHTSLFPSTHSRASLL